MAPIWHRSEDAREMAAFRIALKVVISISRFKRELEASRLSQQIPAEGDRFGKR
jgi:hypothetical protein